MSDTTQELRILIVEDDVVDRLQVQRAIEKSGVPCVFDEALSLSKAREKLLLERYDVIILDNHLPDGFGAKFAADIRGTGLAGAARILMLTGDPEIARAAAGDCSPWQDVLDKDDFSSRRLRAILFGEPCEPVHVGSAEEFASLFRSYARENLPGALETLDTMSREVWSHIDGRTSKHDQTSATADPENRADHGSPP
ncbi:response regulator [Salipiger mucosus]|uniref:Response regulatory domain-containing protein n=1 Tax=Salipiger mucosus DSM 16094 TaxID=1123237 RepID=S9S7G5_9RHOB|nr:response regulator [Salipiger mucosus]EPX82159.1 hypothetical protein Salmuc_02528 [Salipiger mucosus DSM 16094]